MEAPVLDDTRGSHPPLVYVPGIDGTGQLLLETAQRLGERFRLIRLCYRGGLGGRDAAEGFAALAESAADAIGSTGAERSLLLAESFGVPLAIQVALARPHLVGGLALVNGFTHYDRRARLAASRLFGALLPDAVFRIGRRVFAQRLFGPRRDPRALGLFRTTVSSRFDAGYRGRLAMIATVDVTDRLGRIAAPVALFAADRDRVVDAVAQARRMARALDDVTLEVLPRAGHLVLPLTDEPWVERMQALARRAVDATDPGP